MDGPYLSLLDDDLVQTDGLFSNSIDGPDPFDLVAQWDLIPTGEELAMLQSDQQSASVVDNPTIASAEQSTLMEDNRDRQTSTVPSHVLSPSQSPNDLEQSGEIITGSRVGEADETLPRRSLEGNSGMLEATYQGQFYLPAHDESTDNQSVNIPVEDFVQNCFCVLIHSLELDGQNFSICLSEYRKGRRNFIGPEHVISEQDLEEFPQNLSFGNVFGD